MEEKILRTEINQKAKDCLNKGLALQNEGKLDAANICYRSAIKLDSNYKEAFRIKGELHLGRYETTKAKECLDRYLALSPPTSLIYWDLSELYDQLNNFEKAVYFLDRLTELEPTNSKAYYKKTYYLEGLDLIDEAYYNYDLAIKYDPLFYDAYFQKAELLNSENKNKEALFCYNKAIDIDPTNVDSYISKAMLYDKLGNIAGALETIHKAYKINPKDESCRSCYSVLTSLHSSTYPSKTKPKVSQKYI